MKVFHLQREVYRISRLDAAELSPTAGRRWESVRLWRVLRQHGLSAAAAATELGISRATLFRWTGRFLRDGPRGLEPQSRRPHRLRRSHPFPDLVGRIKMLRTQKAWGKFKLAHHLRQQNVVCSESTVGRILGRLRAQGQIQPIPRHLQGRRHPPHRRERPHACRKPKGFFPHRPGELVQLDTMTVTVHPGFTIKQFTAYDRVSRWSAAQLAYAATATAAQRFLLALRARLPFPIRAIQVDGGSEFAAEFEAACAALGIALYVLPPRKPKLNGGVERLHRTWREEFYEFYNLPDRMAGLRLAASAFEHQYNTVRPHRALQGATPLQYLQENFPDCTPRESQMS